MDDSTTCNVSGPLATLLRISSFFGIAPLHFSPLRRVTQHEDVSTPRQPRNNSHHHGFVASLSRRRAYFGRGLIILLSIVQAVFLSLFMKTAFQNTKSTNVLFSLSLVCSWISLIVATFDGVNRIKRYMIHLSKIEKIHNMLHSSYTHQNIMKLSILLWILPLAIIVRFSLATLCRLESVIAINNTTTYIDGLFDTIYDLVHQIKSIFILLLVLQFSLMMCTVRATLRVLNDRLGSLVYKLELYDSIKTTSTKNEHKTLHHIRLAYLSICELVENIDEGEGVLVLILLIYKTVDSMSTLYVILSSFTFEGDLSFKEIAQYGFFVTWIFYDGALIILFMEPCHQTHGEKVKVFVSHLLCFWSDRQFRSELSHFYNECVNNVHVFSPLGVFTFTRKFIIAVIGAIITFITIILQFRVKDKEVAVP